MTNPLIRKDVFIRNGEEFERIATGKEIAKGVGGFFKKTWSKSNYLFIFLVVLLIYIFSTIRYFNWSLFTNIFVSATTVGIVAIGMGLIILLGEIDLSVGSMFAMSIVVSILSYNYTILATGNTLLGFFVCLIASIASGLLLGLVNGFFIGILKMPSFIVTLATMLMYRSFAQYLGDVTRTASDSAVSGWVNGSILNMTGYGPNIGNYVRELGFLQVASITLPAILFILIGVLVWLMTKYTKFGRKIYAVGSNPKAASLVGIKTNLNKTLVFAIAGALVGISGFLHIATRGNVDTSTTGSSYELYAIASVVLGGIAMSGGRGSIIGVIFGAAAFQGIDKIISALNLNPFLNDAIKGAILIIAILIQVLNFDKQKFVAFLQKFGLVFMPNKDLILEAEYKTKVEKLDAKYATLIKKSSKKLSDTELDNKISELLDQKEEILEKLKIKYSILIKKAKVEAQVHDRDQELKTQITKLKNEFENLRHYNTYSLKNKKKEVAPRLNLLYKYEKDIILEQTKQEKLLHENIISLQLLMGMKPKNVEELRSFINERTSEESVISKSNNHFDGLIKKYNENQDKLKAKLAETTSKYDSKLKVLEVSYDEKIASQEKIDAANEEVYVAKIEQIASKNKEKSEKLNAKKLAKEQKLALISKEKADKEKADEIAAKNLEERVKRIIEQKGNK